MPDGWAVPRSYLLGGLRTPRRTTRKYNRERVKSGTGNPAISQTTASGAVGGHKKAVLRELLYGVPWVIAKQAFFTILRKSAYSRAMFASVTSATKMADARRDTSS